jgi:hypothetical protein
MFTIHKAMLLTGALALSVPALADPPWAREGGGKQEKHDKHDKKAKKKRDWHDAFDDDDRIIVRNYYSGHRGHVPPGLAKKGGVPPGLAKKGYVLEPQHHHLMLPLPPDLEKLLPPPPHEVIRRIIGRDMILIHKHTPKVLDVLHDALP